ncbi:actin nucleation-promoting factor WAS isoform X2 [Neoarius graeffei]|uniref:actin nucleation-promoting factor WAS isoform X2 n=1 Tax=Neoarius graeffei TaxID=443677 RepID=UPI00298C9B8E|nr:actin nucleation-promoting factor WAS isoform X2 [Neoarius graeffei]
MSRILSSRLSIREKGLVVTLLGSNCSVSACAVVQLYLATSACKGKKSEWQIHSCGVVCLVQDKTLHSTFIRLFCRAKLLWEQELYIPFMYTTPRPFFHTFLSDECWAGLNFSDEEEASRFHTAVQSCISNMKAHPVLVRTHSLDSTSGWLLRNKLNTCLSVKQSESPEAPPSVESEVTNTRSLVQRKGPLPPIPSATSNPPHHDHLQQKFSIPLPPSYPAPKLNINPAAVKKSVSFSPGGNYSFSFDKHRSTEADDI